MSTKSGIWSTAWSYIKNFPRAAVDRYKRLNTFGKALVWVWLAFECSLVAVIVIVSPARIAQIIYNIATKVRMHPLGWAVFGAAIIFSSLPPIIGHSTLLTLCGFAYGMKGFWIGAIASSIGSALVFLLFRHMFSQKLRAWAASNPHWHALEDVIRDRGLLLMMLIRASPFPPWTYSNAFFASVEPVKLWQFLIATLCVYPKILLTVFIGSKAAKFADGDQRNHMDKETKIVNAMIIASSIILAIMASSITLYLVKKQLRNAKGVPQEVEVLAEEGLDEVDEGAPLLRDFSEPAGDRRLNNRPVSP